MDSHRVSLAIDHNGPYPGRRSKGDAISVERCDAEIIGSTDFPKLVFMASWRTLVWFQRASRPHYHFKRFAIVHVAVTSGNTVEVHDGIEYTSGLNGRHARMMAEAGRVRDPAAARQ